MTLNIDSSGSTWDAPHNIYLMRLGHPVPHILQLCARKRNDTDSEGLFVCVCVSVRISKTEIALGKRCTMTRKRENVDRLDHIEKSKKIILYILIHAVLETLFQLI